MVALPDFWYRPLSFVIAENTHASTAQFMRTRLVSGPEDLIAEAGRMVERDLGPDESFPDPNYFSDESTDQSSRDRLTSDYYNRLAWMEAYTWGLGIAGLYHQWERDTKAIILELSRDPKLTVRRLEQARFPLVLEHINTLGFNIENCLAYAGLDTARLIADTIKHGNGSACRALAEKRRDLFQGPIGVRIGSMAPRAQDLSLSALHFDTAVEDIAGIWTAFEASIVASKGFRI